MTMTDIVNILTGLFEAIIIFMFINTYVEKKDGGYSLHTHIIAVLLLTTLINISNKFVSFTMLNVFLFAVSIFVSAFLYNKQIKINIMLSIIALLILSISEIVVLFLIVNTTGISVEEATLVESYRILGIILSKMLAFIILKVICLKHKQNSVFAMKTSYWLLFIAMFVTTHMAIFLIFRLQYENPTGNMQNFSVWCSFGLLYNTFFSLYLYENISKQAEIERKQELFQQQIRAQAKHLDDILVTQNQIKKLRHDLINHNISIQAFFENQDYQAGLEYMRNINKMTTPAESLIETGNVALDAIINTKKSIALSRGIEFLTNIQIPENIFIDAIDICIIFGNALDNCIEACDRIKNGNKKITVSIIYEDDSVICKIVNTAQKDSNKFLKTIKKDEANHGFGIGNIKSAIAKYKNVCRFTQTDDEFILSFVIFNN